MFPCFPFPIFCFAFSSDVSGFSSPAGAHQGAYCFMDGRLMHLNRLQLSVSRSAGRLVGLTRVQLNNWEDPCESNPSGSFHLGGIYQA